MKNSKFLGILDGSHEVKDLVASYRSKGWDIHYDEVEVHGPEGYEWVARVFTAPHACVAAYHNAGGVWGFVD